MEANGTAGGHRNPRPRSGSRRRGLSMVLWGAIVAVGFGVFLWLTSEDRGSVSPLWIGVLVGVAMMAYGLFRWLRGPNELDFPEGGSNVTD